MKVIQYNNKILCHHCLEQSLSTFLLFHRPSSLPHYSLIIRVFFFKSLKGNLSLPDIQFLLFRLLLVHPPSHLCLHNFPGPRLDWPPITLYLHSTHHLSAHTVVCGIASCPPLHSPNSSTRAGAVSVLSGTVLVAPA